MLLAKINLNQLKNAVICNHTKILSLSQIPRALSTSNWHLKQEENQKGSNEKLLQVYYGSLAPQIRAVKMFSLTTSIVGVCAQPMLYQKATELGSSTPVIVAICGFIGFFTFITPFLIHFITKKYVTELNYDDSKKEYIATIISFFLTKKQIRFTVDDVTVPDVPGMFTSLIVKQKGSGKQIPLFIDPRLFGDHVQHYVKIMGYDKPIDFKLNLTENENSEPEKK